MKFSIQRYEQLPSTNTQAFTALAEGASDGTVIWADYQYAGKGQKGNTWEVEPGMNLTFSLILKPKIPVERVFSISKMAALALHETVQEYLPHTKVEIKWPNDLLVNGKKVAGILIENQLEGSCIKSCVVGMGLNVNQKSFAPDLQHKATSLLMWRDEGINLQQLLLKLLDHFSNVYRLVEAQSWAELDRSYLSYLYGYQQEVPIQLDGKMTSGHLCGVERSGRLVLRIAGVQRSFDIKEVSLVLPQ